MQKEELEQCTFSPRVKQIPSYILQQARDHFEKKQQRAYEQALQEQGMTY